VDRGVRADGRQREVRPAEHVDEWFEDGVRLIIAGIEARYGVR
jgi:hypothetical protein